MEKELLHKYFRGETSPQEEKLIMDWAEASGDNYREYLEERKIWNALLVHYYNIENKSSHTKRVSLLHLYKYAAAVAVIILTVGIYITFTNKTPDILSLQEISEPTIIKNISLLPKSRFP